MKEYNNFKALFSAFKKGTWNKKFEILLFVLLILNLYKTQGLENKISTIQNNNVNTKIEVNDKIIGEADAVAPSTERTSDTSLVWIPNKNSPIDKDGFYCPHNRNFRYWGVWSENRVKANFSLEIRLRLKDNANALGSLPVLTVSYGEYKQDLGPRIIYSVNFFEGNDKKAIRLYDQEYENLNQDYLETVPGLNEDIILRFKSKVINENSNAVYLIPSLTYIPIGKTSEVSFNTSKDFRVQIPSVEIENDSFTQQLGITTSPGGCFKIISSTLSS